MIKGLLALLLVVATVSACDTPNVEEQQSTERFAATLSGATVRTYDPYHGSQIEYHAPDGRAYLWYPGNSGPVPSRWKITNDGVCYKYPSNSYNPVTEESGGSWECQSRQFYASDIKEIISGDPFGLSSGKLPFRLARTKRNTSVAELYRRAGRNPKTLTYRTFSNHEETTQ